MAHLSRGAYCEPGTKPRGVTESRTNTHCGLGHRRAGCGHYTKPEARCLEETKHTHSGAIWDGLFEVTFKGT